MARPQHPEFDKKKVVAENRRARYDYAIESTYEAGIALTGTEVKSLRTGEGSIAESYAEVKDGEVWLINSVRRWRRAEIIIHRQTDGARTGEVSGSELR